jgi:hypothetical protein
MLMKTPSETPSWRAILMEKQGWSRLVAGLAALTFVLKRAI